MARGIARVWYYFAFEESIHLARTYSVTVSVGAGSLANWKGKEPGVEIPRAARLAVPERECELGAPGPGQPCPGTATSPGSAEPLRRQVRAGGAASRDKAKPRTSRDGFGALLWSSQGVCCGRAVCECDCV